MVSFPHGPMGQTLDRPLDSLGGDDGRMVRPHHRRALPLRVGTRASPLALYQTRHFLDIITRFCPVLRDAKAFEENQISTAGDRIQDRRLSEIGGKGLFAKEIHEALLDGRVDFAVHSLKDLETELPKGIMLACTLKREDARDALILGAGVEQAVCPDDPLACIPYGALIGTSSVRRQAQLLYARPDLRIGMLRGNVATRLSRVREGHLAGSLLAYAGLKRLDLEREADIVLPEHVMLPACCQGIIGVTVRSDDHELLELLSAIEDPTARAVSTAERSLLAALDGSCNTPIGGHARVLPGGDIEVEALVARPDGSFLMRRSLNGHGRDAARIGRELGESLYRDAPADLFA